MRDTEQVTMENHKFTKMQTGRNKQWRYKQPEEKRYDGSNKSLYITYHTKWKWIEITSQKAQTS